MVKSQLRSLASLLAEDPQQTRFSGQYDDALNLANRQFALDAGCCKKDAPTYTVVDGTATYALPTDFIHEELVMFKGTKLEPISKAILAFYQKSDRWDDDLGTPEYYNIESREDKKVITLYPIPGANDAGDNIVLTYQYLPSDMSDDAAVPLGGESLLERYQIAVVMYAAWILLGYNPQDGLMLAKRAGIMKQYMDKITECVDTFGDTKSEPLRLRGGRRWRF